MLRSADYPPFAFSFCFHWVGLLNCIVCRTLRNQNHYTRIFFLNGINSLVLFRKTKRIKLIFPYCKSAPAVCLVDPDLCHPIPRSGWYAHANDYPQSMIFLAQHILCICMVYHRQFFPHVPLSFSPKHFWGHRPSLSIHNGEWKCLFACIYCMIESYLPILAKKSMNALVQFKWYMLSSEVL